MTTENAGPGSAPPDLSIPAAGMDRPRPGATDGGRRGADDRHGGGGDDRHGGGGDDRRGGGGNRGSWRFRSRRKVCQFSADKLAYIDYKDIGRIRRYVSDRGKIDSRRKTGTRPRYQRMLSRAIKRAQFMALIPYTSAHVRLSGGVGTRAG